MLIGLRIWRPNSKNAAERLARCKNEQHLVQSNGLFYSLLNSFASCDQGTTLIPCSFIKVGRFGGGVDPLCVAIMRFPSSMLLVTSQFTHSLDAVSDER